MVLNKDISQLGFKTLKQYFNKQFMRELGITFGDVRRDANGDISEIDYFGVSYGVDKFNKNSESVQAIIALITKHKNAFNGCMRGTGVMKFTDRTAREPMKFIGSWLKLFGFKLEALPTERLGIDKVMRNYIINDSKYRAFIVPYLIGRQRDGKNHLTEKKKTYEEYIAGNAMPDAQNSFKPTQATVDKPSTPYEFSNSLIIKPSNRRNAGAVKGNTVTHCSIKEKL